MFESYDTLIPAATPSGRLADAVAADAAPDPYDSLAPVLADVPRAVTPAWPAWSGNGTVAPAAIAGKLVGPTPPDDLFATPGEDELSTESAAQDPVASAAQDPVASAAQNPIEDDYQPLESEPDGPVESEPYEPAEFEPDEPSEPYRDEPPVEQPVAPMVFSTRSPGQPLVVRFELSIVDDAISVRPLDADEAGAKAPTPRHPEFELRPNQVAADAAWHEVPEATPGPAPWATPAVEAVRQDAVDLPWALPELEPLPVQEWTPPWQQPIAQDNGLVPLSEASYALAAPVAAAPVAAAPAAADPADLWFLSSEPEVLADSPHAEKTGQPSSLTTMGLTIGMAVVVIVLVLGFIQLMTSLLR